MKKLRRLEEYATGKHGFWHFLDEVIQYPDLHEPFHRPLADEIQRLTFDKKSTNQLIFLPRNSLKTSVLCIAAPIWWLMINPNDIIYIGCSTAPLAEKRILSIEYMIENNERLWDLGVEKGNPWSRRSLRVRARDNTTDKEDSITVGSVDSTNVGDHYLKMLFDDIVDEKNYKTEKGREEVRHYWRMCQPLGRPGKTKRWVVGTPYPTLNCYDDIISRQTEYDVLVRGYDEQFQRQLDNEPVPGLLFPNLLTEEFVQQQRAVLTSAEWDCFYRCVRPEGVGQRLNLRWLNMPEEIEYFVECSGIGKVSWFDKTLNTQVEEIVRPRMVIDPSLAKKDTDAIGLAVVGWGRDGLRFVVSSWRVVGGLAFAAQKIADVIRDFGIYDMGVEINGYGQLLKKILLAEFYERKMSSVRVHDIFSKGKKENRIESQIQAPARRGEIFVIKNLNREFLQEYEQFPDSPQVDVLDAVAMAVGALPLCKHPTEADIQWGRRPAESYWDQHPSKRAEWLEERMGRPEGSIQIPGARYGGTVLPPA